VGLPDPLGAIHKRRPQSGVVQCGQGGEGVFFRCGRPHFLSQKTLDFSKFYGVSARTREEGGWVSFSDKRGRGWSIFRDFVQTSFMMDGPLRGMEAQRNSDETQQGYPLSFGPEIKDVVPKKERRRGSDAGQSSWVRFCSWWPQALQEEFFRFILYR